NETADGLPEPLGELFVRTHGRNLQQRCAFPVLIGACTPLGVDVGADSFTRIGLFAPSNPPVGGAVIRNRMCRGANTAQVGETGGGLAASPGPPASMPTRRRSSIVVADRRVARRPTIPHGGRSDPLTHRVREVLRADCNGDHGKPAVATGQQHRCDLAWDSKTPSRRFRGWAVLKARREAWWPGAGSNRRPSDFQAASVLVGGCRRLAGALFPTGHGAFALSLRVVCYVLSGVVRRQRVREQSVSSGGTTPTSTV
ncbi:hypothetical protein CLV70_14918, partial [Pseudosporangium ferrugineum]